MQKINLGIVLHVKNRHERGIIILEKISDLKKLVDIEFKEIIISDEAVDYLYDNFEVSLIVNRKKRGIIKQFFSGLFSSISSVPQSSLHSISYSDARNVIKVTSVKQVNDINKLLLPILKKANIFDLSDGTIFLEIN